jgi:NAD(P)-dependent dehydrogenase (short-subunit alcohol dehydrogenase family)
MLADLNDAAGAALAAQIGGGYTHCDVSQAAEVDTLVQTAVSAFGHLDIVINNAGTTHRNQSALEVDEADFDRVWRVNVKSLYHMARACVPVFRARGGGVFVNVASTTAVRPGPGLCWYSGTKAAVMNIGKGLALELAKDRIRVCTINPMIGETALLESFMGMPDTPQNRERFLARIPLGRFTRPADVAAAAVYLASDEAQFLTGVCIDVDGGRNI